MSRCVLGDFISSWAAPLDRTGVRQAGSRYHRSCVATVLLNMERMHLTDSDVLSSISLSIGLNDARNQESAYLAEYSSLIKDALGENGLAISPVVRLLGSIGICKRSFASISPCVSRCAEKRPDQRRLSRGNASEADAETEIVVSICVCTTSRHTNAISLDGVYSHKLSSKCDEHDCDDSGALHLCRPRSILHHVALAS